MKLKQISKMAEYIYNDTLTESTIQESGANAFKVIERLEKNANAMKAQSRFLKGTMFLYLLFIIAFPMGIFQNVHIAISEGVDLKWVICLATFGFAAFFILELLILVMFQVFLFKYVVSGESFRWLATFPIARKDLEKSIFLTMFKSMNVPVYGALLILPITVYVMTQNPLITLISVGFSIVNILYTITFLVNFSMKVNSVFKTTDQSKTKGILIKAGIMVVYILVILVTILGMMFFPEQVKTWLYLEPSGTLLHVFEYLLLLPTPIGPAYLLTLMVLEVQTDILWMPILGMVLWVILSVIVFRRMFNRLPNIIKDQDVAPSKSEGKDEDKLAEKVKKEDVVFESRSPIKAFQRKDRSMFGRDMQMMVYFVLPAMYGIMGVFFIEPEDRFTTISFSYMGISIIFLVLALSQLDAEGSTFLASIPYKPKHQFLAKIWFFPVILIPSYLIPVLFMFNHANYVDLVLSTLIWIWWGPIWGIFGFELKILLFGKMKNKYVIEEVSNKHKVLKWFIFGATIVVISSVTMVIFMMVMEDSGMIQYLLYNVIGFAIFIVIDYILYKFLFREKKPVPYR